MSDGNYRAPEVAAMLDHLNRQWEQLVSLSMDKGKRLRQAAAQHGYNRTMDDANNKLGELQNNLQSQKVGSDLRNCKQLLKKHQVLFIYLIHVSTFINNWVFTCYYLWVYKNVHLFSLFEKIFRM